MRSFLHRLVMTFHCFLHRFGFSDKLTLGTHVASSSPSTCPQFNTVLFGELPSHCYVLKVEECKYNEQECTNTSVLFTESSPNTCCGNDLIKGATWHANISSFSSLFLFSPATTSVELLRCSPETLLDNWCFGRALHIVSTLEDSLSVFQHWRTGTASSVSARTPVMI